MNDQQFNEVFDDVPKMPSALAEKIRAQIQRDTQPVKPMRSTSAYALVFAVVFALVSLAFAAIFKFKGIHALSTEATAELLLLLLTTALLGTNIVARSMRPAGGRLHIWLLGAFAFVVYEALVLRLFSDYATDRFVHTGVLCLSLGVLCGVLVALPLWLIVRKGFVVQPVRAGAAIGLVGGLSGITFLTLHCPILTVPHTSIWHAAVIVVCVTGGAIAGRLK